MIHLELFSGIGGFSKGLLTAGYTFDKVYYSEIDKHAIANFKYNYPNATYIGSVTDIHGTDIERPDIITFGSPCQNFSPIGDGKGLMGRESGLVSHAIEAVRRFRPDVFIWENVKGVLFAKHRSDFWEIIKAFADIGGYRLEWQLFNTSWFLPQNRERIYLVGRLTERCAAGIFPLLPQGCFDNKGRNCPLHTRPLFGAVMRGYYKQPNTGNYLPCLLPGEEYGKKPTENMYGRIRMLTEIECERLQGFPDDYTRYGIYGDEQKEIRKCHRYALLGNAVSVPVVAAITKRIKETTHL